MKWMRTPIKVFVLSIWFLCFEMSTAFALNDTGEVRVDGSSTVFSYYRSSSGGIYKGASRRENFHQYFWNWGEDLIVSVKEK